MHFAAQNVSDNRTTKLALVVVFHVILGACLVKSMGVKLLARPVEATPFTLMPDVVIPVPPQPTDALPPPTLPAPPVFVPQMEVPLPTPALPNTVTTTTTASADPAPPARTTDATTPPASSGTGTGTDTGVAKVRSAAMVDGCAKPDYPKQAARNGDAGIVTLALLVGVDGRVTGARIEHSSGFRDLDRAALTALSLCTFRPAMQGDVAQAGWALIAYEWKLD